MAFELAAFLAPGFWIPILIFVMIMIILAVSLNLALGFTGLLNLGHVGLFAIGAYTSAILTTSFESNIFTGPLQLPFLVGILGAGIVSGAFGFFLIWATKNLRGDYLALATLGFGFIVLSLLKNIDAITGLIITKGTFGINEISRPIIFGFPFETDIQMLILSAIIAVISIYVMNLVASSSFGRLAQATRDDELGVRVLGKNTTNTKYKIMLISGFFAGIAGSLFAHHIRFIEPNSFFLSEIILVLTVVIVGGLASIKGSVLAAFLIIFIQEGARLLPVGVQLVGPFQKIFFAVLLLGIILFRPRGIFGRVDLE